MANPDSRYCSIEEYDQGKRERVFVGDLAFDGLYKLMSLITDPMLRSLARAEAIQAFSRIADVQPSSNGIHVVELALLDANLETAHGPFRIPFRDGYMLDGQAPNFTEKGYFLKHGPASHGLAQAAVRGADVDLPPDTPIEELVEAYLP